VRDCGVFVAEQRKLKSSGIGHASLILFTMHHFLELNCCRRTNVSFSPPKQWHNDIYIYIYIYIYEIHIKMTISF
jgi:hypothetical protein